MLAEVDFSLFEALPYAPLAFGLVLLIRYQTFVDVTCAASFSLGAAVVARLAHAGWHPALAVAVGLGGAALLGALTAVLRIQLRLDKILAGLLSSTVGYALSLLFTEGSLAIDPRSNPLASVASLDMPWRAGTTPLHPHQILVFGLVALAGKLALDVFLRSEAGVVYRALEDERSAVTLLSSLGLSPGRWAAGGIVAGNLLAASSGVLVAFKENQATAQRGFDALLTVLSGYLLGVTLFERRAELAGAHRLGRVRKLGPTGAALAGLVLYFGLLVGIAGARIPASVPKLLIVAIIVTVLAVEHRARAAATRVGADRTVAAGAAGSLSVVDARVVYPAHPVPIEVVRGASLEVPPGSLVLLSAPNGAGKSSLLRYLGALIPGAGTVGVPTARAHPPERRTDVAYVSQDAGASTCATLTVDEHLTLYRLPARPSPFRPWLARRPSAAALLPVLDGRGGVPVQHLSGGQRQSLSLASLLLRREPPLTVLLDEPLTYLDEESAKRCVDLIEEMLGQGRRILLVQHDLVVNRSPAAEQEGARARLEARIDARVSLLDATEPP